MTDQCLLMPGPTAVPARVAGAMEDSIIDHRGPAFAERTLELLPMLSQVFATAQPVVIYPSSGTGAAEAALVNTLSPGDRVLVFNSGYFAERWSEMAARHDLDVVVAQDDWERAVDVSQLETALRHDPRHRIKAVLVVHSETSTGLAAPIAAIRSALDDALHPALLIVDAVSSLAVMPYEHDRWGVDVTVSCSQKGLMLPPGLGFNAVSEKALQASRSSARLSRSYWSWQPILEANRDGYFPYTPPISLLAGLRESLSMLIEETPARTFARHAALAELARNSVAKWGLEIVSPDEPHSNSLTVFRMPQGFDADEIHGFLSRGYALSLGKGLGLLAGKVLRIGHLGQMDVRALTQALGRLEEGLAAAEVVATAGVGSEPSPGAPTP